MARWRRRRGKRGKSLGGFLRTMPQGFVQLGLAVAILALVGAVSNAITGYVTFNLTVGSSTVTIDLGFIPSIILAFTGIYLLISGLRKIAHIKI